MKPTPYSDYKKTSMEWLGSVPNHWKVLPLRRVVQAVRTGSTPIGAEDSSFDDSGFNWYTPIDFSERLILNQSDRALSEKGKHEVRIFPPMTVMLVGIGATIGKVGLALNECSCNQQINGIICSDTLNPFYAAYFMRTMRDFIVKCGKYTTMPIINQEETKNLIFTLPPLPEQKSIAAFLDRETGRIDTLIAKKQKQIELLQRKRAALISQAATEGLDQNAKMKDSGVEWLGKVPEHWTITRSKNLFTEINERSLTGEEELLTVSHLTGVTKRSEKNVTMFMAESLEDYKKCQPDDLVINTMWAWMGALGFTNLHGIVSPSYNVYRRKIKILPSYFDLLFRSPPFVAEIVRWSKGIWSSRLRLYPDEFFEIILPVPPIEEQIKIVEKIEMETGHYTSCSLQIEKSIVLLKKYRSSLISAAVTGKIDVSTSLNAGVRKEVSVD